MPNSNHTIKLRGQGRRTHGFNSGGKRTPELAAHNRMIQRCTNPRHHKFNHYGGRGIKICEGWRSSPVSFVHDVGLRPSAIHSVNRIDNNGHYSCGHCDQCIHERWPLNVAWATPTEQQHNTHANRYFTFQGETLCLVDWSRRLGITDATLIARLKRWPLERALTEPRHITKPRRANIRA